MKMVQYEEIHRAKEQEAEYENLEEKEIFGQETAIYVIIEASKNWKKRFCKIRKNLQTVKVARAMITDGNGSHATAEQLADIKK